MAGWQVQTALLRLGNGSGGSDGGVWDSPSPSVRPSCSSAEAAMPCCLTAWLVMTAVQVLTCPGIVFDSVLVNYWFRCRFPLE